MTKKTKNRDEYMHGRPGAKYGIYNTAAKYGIYNTAAKCFHFDICEDTPMLAEARLFQKIGDDARKWRFEPRRLPPDGPTAKITVIDEWGSVQNDIIHEQVIQACGRRKPLDREERWARNLAHLNAGGFGSLEEPETLLRFWEAQEAAGYPGASENVKYFKSVTAKEGKA